MITLPYDITCGYFACKEFGDLKVSPKRRSTKFEIEFYLDDGLKTITDNVEYEIKKHHIQIAKPNQIRYSHLPFKTAYLKFNVDGELAEILNKSPQYFYCNHPKEFLSLIDEIILLLENNNQLLLYSRLLAIINLILVNSQIVPGYDFSFISKAKLFIHNHYDEKITLDDIAKSVNMSKIYFHNLFSMATGKTPHKYLTEYRIELSKKMLWNTKINLEDIAEKCGFCSQQHFNLTFKKITGMTPRQYRISFHQKYYN